MNNEEILFDIVQKILLSDDPKNLIKTFNEFIENAKMNNSKINTLKRVVLCYQSFIEGRSNFDIFPNIRQAIITFNRRVYILENLKKHYESLNYSMWLLCLEDNDSSIYLDCEKSNIIWSKNQIWDEIDIYNDNSFDIDEKATGDYKLKYLTGFNSYRSYCQKIIVQAMDKQIGGTTILATMPTGGGKSLPTQIISFFEKNSMTVVVVPTVALVIDQENSSKKFLKGKKIFGYHSGLDEDEKKEMLKCLRAGEISILYTSPEAIINGILYNELIKLAKKNILKRLVIDEAHLVIEWGEFFRTEFQFISVFRKILLKESNNNIKTVLLSATVTEKTEKVLKDIYSENNNFIQIRGDSLREEIEFFIFRCSNQTQRKNRIKEILPLIPKPFIIYVPTIEDANNYYEMCMELNFNRVEKFTSKTDPKERKRILNSWDLDRTDIIIATSAFGMGVDKKEIRAVVHTFVPESVDRFYQEVGRGGRDGYKSLSLLFSSFKEDEDMILYLTRNKVLKAENIVKRWNAIMNSCIERKNGDEYIIAVNSIPENLLENMYTGKLNEAWNEYVILFMYRKKLIDITDIKYDQSTLTRHLNIKILNVDVMSNLDELEKYLDPIRSVERVEVDKDIHLIKNIIKDNKTCWGRQFEKVYKRTEQKCIGCPSCRAHKEDYYFNEKDYFEVSEGATLLKESFNRDKRVFEELVFVRDMKNNIHKINYLIDKYDIDCVITDNLEIKDFLLINKNSSYIYNYDEFMDSEKNYINGNIILIVEISSKLNKIFKKFMNMKNKDIKASIIVAETDIEIEYLNRNLANLTEGKIYSL